MLVYQYSSVACAAVEFMVGHSQNMLKDLNY